MAEGVMDDALVSEIEAIQLQQHTSLTALSNEIQLMIFQHVYDQERSRNLGNPGLNIPAKVDKMPRSLDDLSMVNKHIRDLAAQIIFKNFTIEGSPQELPGMAYSFMRDAPHLLHKIR